MKKTMSASLILCLLFQTSSALAAPSAKVVMTRGEVTKLKPGERDASPVKRGEVLPEDTSVLTGEKSVVRLRFADNSTMNLGPKSKVVISKMPEQKPNMINLLTGAIKAEVDKKENEKKKTKMIIKTRSAVMGVRGTKFQAVYNAQNKNTSLVTIEGKVAMVKKEKPVLKSAQDLTAEGPARVADSDAELDAFDKSLQESKEAVEVDAGKYSGVQESAQAPSQPVKIAPKQYEAMAKSMNSKNTAEEVMGTEDALGEIEALESAPKPGGFVDFETAIYVPPSEEALLDNETATFTAEEDMGDVDQATGDYIPPKGVKLDAKEGFVVDQEEIAKVASNEEKEEMQRTLAKMESVNKDVKKQVAASANKIEKKVEASRPWYRPDTHELQIEAVPYSEVLTLDDGEGKHEFYSESASEVILSWKQNWNQNFATSIRIGGVDYQFEQANDSEFIEEESDESEYFSIGAAYSLGEKWQLSLDLVSKTFYFAAPSRDSNSVEVLSDTFNYLSLGARYFLMDWKKVAVHASGNLLVFGEDSLYTFEGEEKVESFGFKGALEGDYSFSKNTGLAANLFLQEISHDVTTAHHAKFSRTSLGTGLNFFWKL